MGLTAPVVQSWTLADMVVVLAEAGHLEALVVAPLGCWTLMKCVVVAQTLMYQIFAETGSLMGLVVVLMGSWTLMGPMAGNVNLDATASATPRHCGLT